MTPAVRSPSRPCIEEGNCNWELATVCAFNQTNTTGQVAFLACMDEKAMGSAASMIVGTQVALNAAKHCSVGTSIDVQQLASCYGGPEGQGLLSEASKVFNKQFPGPASVPHTFVGSKDVHAGYSDLKNAICAAGSTAPACKTLGNAACVI
jgi:hypothetical protein|eukprot:g755.t1